MSILNRLLEKKGLKSKEELTAQERAQFDNWSKILESELKVEDIERNIGYEVKRLTEEWLAEDSKNPFNFLFHWKREVEIKARIKNYNIILNLISNKAKEKENLMKYIKSLIK